MYVPQHSPAEGVGRAVVHAVVQHTTGAGAPVYSVLRIAMASQQGNAAEGPPSSGYLRALRRDASPLTPETVPFHRQHTMWPPRTSPIPKVRKLDWRICWCHRYFPPSQHMPPISLSVLHSWFPFRIQPR